MYAMDYEVYFHFIFNPFVFFKLQNIIYIKTYSDNLFNMKLYMDLHA